MTTKIKGGVNQFLKPLVTHLAKNGMELDHIPKFLKMVARLIPNFYPMGSDELRQFFRSFIWYGVELDEESIYLVLNYFQTEGLLSFKNSEYGT